MGGWSRVIHFVAARLVKRACQHVCHENMHVFLCAARTLVCCHGRRVTISLRLLLRRTPRATTQDVRTFLEYGRGMLRNLAALSSDPLAVQNNLALLARGDCSSHLQGSETKKHWTRIAPPIFRRSRRNTLTSL